MPVWIVHENVAGCRVFHSKMLDRDALRDRVYLLIGQFWLLVRLLRCRDTTVHFMKVQI